jgi:hypothetical protein
VAIRGDPLWAQVSHGSWIGAHADIAHTRARSLLVASVSFHIAEPTCASFALAFAADGHVRSALLNGNSLHVPPHGFRTTTAQVGAAGLTAGRGQGLFSFGLNRVVLTITNDAGALGLYVSGSVQLYCPLDEATISMHPALGPAAGGTTVKLRSNVLLYVERWIRCSFGDTSVHGTVVDGYTMLCRTPELAPLSLRTWVDVAIVSSHQGDASVGVHYRGQHLSGSFYYHGEFLISNVEPPSGPTAGGTVIALCGRFEHLSEVRCRFGTSSTATVVPRVVDSTRIECTSTPQPTRSLHKVELTLTADGQHFAESRVMFAYYPQLAVASIHPKTVNTEGDTVVTLRVNELQQGPLWLRFAFCRFNTLSTPATLRSKGALQCNSPPLLLGYAAVELTLNAQDYTISGLRVQVVQVSVQSLQPTSGPQRGGTKVLIYGSNLLGDFSCLFGGRVAVATECHGRSRLACRTQGFSNTGWVAVQLAEGL